MRRYRQLLRTPGGRTMVVAGLLARVPVPMLPLAILLAVQERTGSFGPAGAMTAALAIGSGVGAPVRGRLADRFGATRILAVNGCAQAVLLVALFAFLTAGVTGPAAWPVAAAVGAASPPAGAVIRTAWTRMLDDDDLRHAAFALEGSLAEFVFVAGPLLVALLVVVASPTVALLLAAGFVAAGNLALSRLPAVRGIPARDRSPHWLGALASPGVRWVLPIILFELSGFAAVEVTVAAHAVEAGHRGLAGPVLAAMSLAGIAGGLLWGLRRSAATVPVQMLRLTLAGAAPLALLPVTGSLAGVTGLIALAGLTIAPLLTLSYTAAQQAAPAGTSTEALTWLVAAGQAGSSIGAALSGWVVAGHGATAGGLVAFTLFAGSLPAVLVLGRVTGRPGGPAQPDAPAIPGG